jgi:hypothetical protein
VSVVAGIPPRTTWLLVAAVLIVVGARHLLVATAGDAFRKARARAMRVRATGEGATRRRVGAELHVPDWEVRGWFGADDQVVPITNGRAAREASRGPVPTRRSA